MLWSLAVATWHHSWRMMSNHKYSVGDKLTVIGVPMDDFDTGSVEEVIELLDPESDDPTEPPMYRVAGRGIYIESELAPTDSPEAAEEAGYELGHLLGEY
jgi:hypothetical protein